MKNLLMSLALAASGLGAVQAHAGTVKVETMVAKDTESPGQSVFSRNTSQIMVFFRTKGTEAGDELTAVWIAEDTAGLAPPDFEIDQSSLTADRSNFSGAFSLSKPNKGWPAGSYRVEVYVGDELVVTPRFTVK